jgi:hypothetical protein
MKHSRGISLLELLASLSLAMVVGLLAYSLYRQGQGTLKQWFKRHDAQSRHLAFSQLQTHLLLRGQGLVEVAEQALEVVTVDGRRMRLEQAFGDSVATLNGKAPIDSICDLQIKAFGAALSPDPFQMPGMRANAENLSQGIAQGLRDDSLDTNRDGLIEFSELDVNQDNRLDSLELGRTRLIEMQWRRCGESHARHRLVIAPRNRVSPQVESGL